MQGAAPAPCQRGMPLWNPNIRIQGRCPWWGMGQSHVFRGKMNIKEILKNNKLMLAPMAGITDLAFREIVRERQHSMLCFSEMISAKALSYNDKNTYELLKTSKLDGPLAIQLFGHEPDIMAESAKKIEDMGFSMIDINCGCPAPKIVKNGDGSALMKNPELIHQIVSKIRRSVASSISVKLRLGFDPESINVSECARLCEEAGADFITIHGRTRDMQYSGKADLTHIKEVKSKISIPVIGNGDVCDNISCQNMLLNTNCDGIMIGRAALGNPFIFETIKNPNAIIQKKEKMETFYRQALKMCENKHNAIKESRMHFLWYLKGYKNAKFYKEKASKVLTIQDVEGLVSEIIMDDNVC